MPILFNKPVTLVDTLVFALVSALLQPFMPQLLLPVHNYSWWQLFSAHWVHLNWVHWALNMGVLFTLSWLFPFVARKHLWFMLVVLPVPMSLALIYLNQLQHANVSSYVGASGILHGVFMVYALSFLWQRHVQKIYTSHQLPLYFSWQAALLALLLLAKVVFEHLYKHSQTANMLDATVVFSAHLDGLMCGLVYFFVMLFISRYQQKNMTQKS